MEPLTVPGTLEALESIGKYVMEAASAAGLDRKVAYRLRLGVDEIATNIVVYGYQPAGQEGDIKVMASLDDEQLTIALEDTSPAFDPLQHRTPDEDELARSLDERTAGGLGVMLAIEGVDNFSYEYVDGRNRNIFVVNRPRVEPAADAG
jgi:serine/threonine-protein kinase RsbW